MTAATLCYICAGNIDQSLRCWLSTSEKSSPFHILQEIMEKVSLFRAALQSTEVPPLLAEKYCQYADALASQGQFSIAADVLACFSEPQFQNSDGAILLDRVTQALEVKAAIARKKQFEEEQRYQAEQQALLQQQAAQQLQGFQQQPNYQQPSQPGYINPSYGQPTGAFIPGEQNSHYQQFSQQPIPGRQPDVPHLGGNYVPAVLPTQPVPAPQAPGTGTQAPTAAPAYPVQPSTPVQPIAAQVHAGSQMPHIPSQPLPAPLQTGGPPSAGSHQGPPSGLQQPPAQAMQPHQIPTVQPSHPPSGHQATSQPGLQQPTPHKDQPASYSPEALTIVKNFKDFMSNLQAQHGNNNLVKEAATRLEEVYTKLQQNVISAAGVNALLQLSQAFLAYDYNQVSQILQSSSTVLYSEVGYKGMVGISKLKRFLTGGR